MLRKIKKVHLHPTGKVDVQFEEMLDENGKKDKNSKESDEIAHNDLVDAFKKLDIHLATKCKQGLYTDFEDQPGLLDDYHVTQFTIAGDGDHEGIVLTGQRKLDNNEILNLNTPFIKFHKDHSNYIYISSLEAEVKAILSEVDQYINKTKLAPKPQMELNFDNEGDELPDEEQEDHDKKPLKKHVRKLKKTLDDAELKMVAH